SRLTLPLGPSNSYFFSTAIHGIRRRSAAIASRARVRDFSFARSCSRAASHSCRDTIGGVFIPSCPLRCCVSFAFLLSICHFCSYFVFVLELGPLNTRPEGSASPVLGFQILDILVVIFLSRTIATPPAVAPRTETPPVINHAALLKHTGHLGQFTSFIFPSDTRYNLLLIAHETNIAPDIEVARVTSVAGFRWIR